MSEVDGKKTSFVNSGMLSERFFDQLANRVNFGNPSYFCCFIFVIFSPLNRGHTFNFTASLMLILLMCILPQEHYHRGGDSRDLLNNKEIYTK